MKEKRVYAVNVSKFDDRDIDEVSNEEFIEEAERVGWVWSSAEAFVKDWNGFSFCFPERENAEARIIEVEV